MTTKGIPLCIALSLTLFVITAVPTYSTTDEERALLIELAEPATASAEAFAMQAARTGMATDPAAIGVSGLDALSRKLGAIEVRRALRPGGRFEEAHGAAGLLRWYRVVLAPGVDPATALDQYRANPNVSYAEMESHYVPMGVPNDPQYSDQWHYGRIGMPAAWDVETGQAAITVQVIDSGIDLQHEDLVAVLWTNPGEIPGNGLDDDNNGYVDDIHGWNYTANSPDLDDQVGHGTHCAGTIGAVSNNHVGVAGMAGGIGQGGVRLMSTVLASTSGACEAFVYGADNGASVSSNSWGCGSREPCESGFLNHCLDYFRTHARPQGGLVVFAAGNDATDSPRAGQPALYAPALTVAATDSFYNKASFSNFGGWVDVSAPGVGVTSTVPGGYGVKDGTSMAAPHVAGLAALLLSHDPSLSAADVQRLILETTDDFGPKGQIQAEHALRALSHVQSQGIRYWTIRRAISGSGSEFSTTGFTRYVFLNGYQGASVAPGVYLVRRREMRMQLAPGDFIGPVYLFPIQGSSTQGWSAANPNPQIGYCNLIAANGSSFTLQTFVYETLDILGQSLGWLPVRPGASRCAYGVIGELRCGPPAEGTWNVKENCTIDGNVKVGDDVVIWPGVVLTVAASGTLDVDFAEHRLLVRKGGGVLVKKGGRIF